MKYYAVKEGRVPNIYTSWEECKAQVHKFSGAKFKSFSTREEAEIFMKTPDSSWNPECSRTGESITEYLRKNAKNQVLAYTDGSYNDQAGIASYGILIYNPADDTLYESSGVITDPEWIVFRNISGELKGAVEIMKYCIARNIKTINLVYDYMGIEKWTTGEWSSNNRLSQGYVNFYNQVKEYLNVNFRHVKGHTGEKGNAYVDHLAAEAVKKIL